MPINLEIEYEVEDFHVHLINSSLIVRWIFIINSTCEFQISYYRFSSILITFRVYLSCTKNALRDARKQSKPAFNVLCMVSSITDLEQVHALPNEEVSLRRGSLIYNF